MKELMVGIDFGTSNSGAIIGFFNNSDSSTFETINHNVENNYAKEPTFLLINKDLLDGGNMYDMILNVGQHMQNENILFGQKAVSYCLENDSSNFVQFDDLKMNLYDDVNYVIGHTADSIGMQYDIVTIISVYVACLRNSVLEYLQKVPWGDVADDQIEWAISIPAIWNDNAKKKMEDVCKNVFGTTTIVRVLEPEAACIFVLTARETETKVGDRYLIVDMGGGTTDIVGLEITKGGCEECVKHDGLPIAGKKIDELFWQFFSEKICENVSNYNDCAPKTKYQKFIGNYFSNLANKLEMQLYWESIKRSRDFLSDFVFDFKIPNSYIQWLDTNGFEAIVDELEKKAGRIVDYKLSLNSKDIREKVYDPIKNKIINIVRDKIVEAKDTFDKIILTGGLSCNKYMQSEIRDAIGKKVYYSYDTGASTNFKAGGAVLYGIPTIFIDGTLIKRRSVLYYYIDCCTKIDNDNIADKNLERYFMYKYDFYSSQIRTQLEKEKDYFYCWTDSRNCKRVDVLDPICEADKIYTKFNESFTPISDTQKVIEFNIYSSEQVCFLIGENNKKNPNIKLEGTVEIPLRDHERVWCRVDFNDVENSYWIAYFSYEKDGSAVDHIKVERVKSNYGH